MRKWTATLLLLLALFCGCRMIESQADDPNSWMNQNAQNIGTTTKAVGGMLPFPFNVIAIGAGTLVGAGWRQYVQGRKLQQANTDLAGVSDNAKRLGLTLASVTQAIDLLKKEEATAPAIEEFKVKLIEKFADLGVSSKDANYLIAEARNALGEV